MYRHGYTTYTNGVYNLQDIEYQYDVVGNITKIKQNAIAAAGMGGNYTQDYTYNNRHRLVRNDFTSTPFGNYRYDVSYSPTGRMGSKSCNNLPGSGPFSLNYGYDDKTLTHQSRVIYDYDSGERLQMYWDRDGNLEQIQPAKSAPRYHLWDDEDRLLASIGGTTCGFYGNAGDGKRAYKMTGGCSYQQWNNGTIIAYLTFDDVVLYPNPYITVTPQGYTKHYFAGTERIATAMGGGGFCNMIVPTDNLTNTEQVRKHEILKYLSSYLSDQTEDHTNNEDIAHQLLPELQYGDARQTLHNISYNIYLRTSLCTTLNELCNKQKDDEVFYYHPDHLGGAAWITDMSGKPVQYLHYAPYGEMVANQMPYGIDERFKFTGKERDAETGYDNHDARYRWTVSGDWLSVDPLADKFIDTQPYMYCNGDPIGYIDPNGMIWTDIEGNEITDHTNIKVYIYYDPESFTDQAMDMYNEAIAKYGIGSVALSNATTRDDFNTDWNNMSSPSIREVNLNYHGNNQTLMLNSAKGEYITATGDGITNRLRNKALNVQDLSNPMGNIRRAKLNINSCKSNSKNQFSLKGNKLTLMEAFYYRFHFFRIRGTTAGVSYSKRPHTPEPQYFWQHWDYFYHYPKNSSFPKK